MKGIELYKLLQLEGQIGNGFDLSSCQSTNSFLLDRLCGAQS